MQASVYIGIKAHRRRRTVHTTTKATVNYNQSSDFEIEMQKLQLLTTFQVFQALPALYQPF